MTELYHVNVQIYAFDRSFEGAIAACGAPLVGIIAEKLFGFKVGFQGVQAWMSMPALHRCCSTLFYAVSVVFCAFPPTARIDCEWFQSTLCVNKANI